MDDGRRRGSGGISDLAKRTDGTCVATEYRESGGYNSFQCGRSTAVLVRLQGDDEDAGEYADTTSA